MINRNCVSQDFVLARGGNSKRVAICRAFLMAALVFTVVLIPRSGWANTTKNCPVEPAQGVPIVSGETYSGTNCLLTSASDLDTFTFTAAAGDTWKIVDGSANVVAGENICLTVNDPKGNTVATGCSAAPISHSATLISKPTASGTYTIVVTETGNAVMNYGVSLERISPPPGDGTAVVLGKTIVSAVTPVSAQDAYTFFATTTGTYEVSATQTSGGAPENLCFSVYQPGGTAVVSSACTSTPIAYTTQAKFTPSANGTFVVIVYASDSDYTLNYTINVACVAGVCGSSPTTCSLKDALTYNATTGTLTMNFTVGTPVAVTWNGWLTSQNSMQALWSQSLAITEPSVTMTKTHALPKSGKVGVLSTLTTPTKGITCSSWAMVNTGTP